MNMERALSELLRRDCVKLHIPECRCRLAIPFSLALLALLPCSHAQQDGTVGPPVSGTSLSSQNSQGAANGLSIMRRKLQSIMIPEFTLNDATLEEAVEKLRQLSRQFDTTETDPAKKGVNIVIQSNPGINPHANEARNSGHMKITLSLRNVPLGAVIKYVGESANMTVKIEAFAVIFSSSDN